MRLVAAPRSAIPAVCTSIAAERNSNWLRNVGKIMYHWAWTSSAGCRVMHFRCFKLLNPSWRLLSGVWRRMWEASVVDGSRLSLYAGHQWDLWRPRCFLVANTWAQEIRASLTKFHNEERGCVELQSFHDSVFLSVMWGICLFITRKTW